MFNYLFIYLNLIVMALAITIKFELKIEISVLITIIGISLTQYFIALFSNLVIGNIVVFIVFLFSFIYLFYIWVKNKNIKEITNNITIELILFTICYILSIIIFKEKVAVRHNELSNWALVVKNISSMEQLPKINSNMLYVGYPLIIGIWEYWFSHFFSVFTDGNLYIANAILQFALITAIVGQIKAKTKLIKVITYMIIIEFLYIGSKLIFSTLFVDITLSLITIFSFVYIDKLNKINIKDIVIITLILSFLVLVKTTGILFAFIIIVFLFWSIKEHETMKNRLKVIASIMIGILCIKLTWTIYLRINCLNQAWDMSGFKIENIINFIMGNGKAYQYEVLPRFLKEFAIGNNITLFFINFSGFVIMILTLVFMITLYYVKKDNKIKKITQIVFLTDVIFLLGLLLMYIFSFAQWEANTLSAFTRYIDTLNVINIGVLVYVYLDRVKNKKGIILICILIILINIQYTFVNEIIHFKSINQETQAIRDRYNTIQKYKKVLTQQDKVLLITETIEEQDGDSEIDLLHLKYMITPYRLYMYSKIDSTKDEIITKLKCGYTYIFFYQVDLQIQEKYKFLIDDEIKSETLYRIIDDGEKLKIKEIEI